MPDFINPNAHTVYLVGPDGRTVPVKPNQSIVLSEYFERYCARGFLQRVTSGGQPQTKPAPRITRIDHKRPVTQQIVPLTPRPPTPVPTVRLARATIHRAVQQATTRVERVSPNQERKIVGRVLNVDAIELLRNNLAADCFPISNGIGVGIMSFNRAGSLQRLIDSIVNYTDLRRTTVFVSDDGSTDPTTLAYLNQINPNIVVLKNQQRIGVAGNSNRLLRCLARFDNCLLLNDDVEVLAHGWEYYYADIMQRLGFHHLIYRQSGIYGVQPGSEMTINGIPLTRVEDKPQGAILAFTNAALRKCGHFNEAYGLYGMEHVDWSQRVVDMGLQVSGFYDVSGSDRYFKVHAEPSVVPDRQALLEQARAVHRARDAQYVVPSGLSVVPAISYVIPFRNIDREPAIRTVVNNVRAQRYPQINIVLVEQDAQTRIDLAAMGPVEYLLASNNDDPLFNKSHAFNRGVSLVTTPHLVLHDADTMATGSYTAKIAATLDQYESCHLGGKMLYTTQEAANTICQIGMINSDTICDRVIGYYEGGSLACRTQTYWAIGGFNESFRGYGCEDCDFYARLSKGSNWFEERSCDLLHIWHTRITGWESHHYANKVLEDQLKALTIEERILSQRAQLADLGYIGNRENGN